MSQELVNTEAINYAVNTLATYPLTRGVVADESYTQMQLTEAGKNGKLSVAFFYGFTDRQSPNGDPIEALAARDKFTISALAQLKGLDGLNISPVIIAADEHANFNGLPRGTYDHHYAGVAKYAAEHDIKTVYLSKVLGNLGLSTEALIQRGTELTDFDMLDEQTKGRLNNGAENQRRRLLQREYAHWGRSERKQMARNYLYLRQGENDLLIPNLRASGLFPNQALIVGHFGDPEVYGQFVGGGHYISALDDAGKRTTSTPWSNWD